MSSKTRKSTKKPRRETPPIVGAIKGPDGNWYIPDESRPGKYLQIVKKGEEEEGAIPIIWDRNR